MRRKTKEYVDGLAGMDVVKSDLKWDTLSLVLAIEFIDSGKVLLFPGDAEFGSWKSWQSIDWSDRFPDLTTHSLRPSAFNAAVIIAEQGLISVM